MSSRFPTLVFARALLLTNLKSALALRGNFLLQVTFMMLNNLIFFVFWWMLLDRVPNVRGYGLSEMEALFGISAAGFGLGQALFGGVRHLARFIDEGELDSLLTQPKPTLLYALGMRSQPSGFGDVLSGLFLLWLSGYLRLETLPFVVLAIAASALGFLGSGIVFFSLPFFLGRSEVLSRQLWDLTITFSLYPEPLFGGVLRFLLYTVLPAGIVSYLPLAVVRGATLFDVAALAAGAVCYVLLGAYVFERGLRRYTSGSRFGVFG